MIRNIIFDMGGVLIHWGPAAIIERLGLSDADFQKIYREVFCGMEWACMDHGLITQEEGFHRICRRLPMHLHDAAHSCVFDWWKEPLDPMEGMSELICEIKNLGYPIYLLSNATSTLHQYFHRIPGSEFFDGILVSADVKLLKPQHEIFEKLFELYGLNPEECFFIDDSALNIDGAYAVGMPGTVFFGDIRRLRSELREAGIPVHSEPGSEFPL